jgi:type IV secretory pathway TrbF-like protein
MNGTIETPWQPPQTKDFAAARSQYVEMYGSLAVMNTYLKIALLLLAAVIVAQAALAMKIYESARHVEPLVIRINEVGRADAVSYGSLHYQPQEAEIKYFLAEFARQHYGRMRATVRENYTRSLCFLDGRLAEAFIETNKKSKSIETFLTSNADEADIDVKNVAIEDLRKSPYKAAVEFERVYFSPVDRKELRRVRSVANFVFIVKQPVPNSLIPFNPLGLTITYFREDQAFQ